MTQARTRVVTSLPSKWRLNALPVASVMLGSMIPTLIPLVANSPIMPPLGLLFLLAWRLLRHEMWPLWIGAPLGLFDDLFSGQPMGSSMGLWSLAIILIDFADRRLYWRRFSQDWALAGLALVLSLGVGAHLALPTLTTKQLIYAIGPQLIGSFLLFPLVFRVVAMMDRWRLKR